MKFSTKTRYALKAMIEIAKADDKTKIYQKDISKSQQISPKYLDQIIQSLKSAGLIANVKGRKSGYRLTRNASEISIFQIHTAFEPEIAIIECLSEYVQCDMEDFCGTNHFWSALNKLVIDYLQTMTLQDLINKKEIKYRLILTENDSSAAIKA